MKKAQNRDIMLKSVEKARKRLKQGGSLEMDDYYAICKEALKLVGALVTEKKRDQHGHAVYSCGVSVLGRYRAKKFGYPAYCDDRQGDLPGGFGNHARNGDNYHHKMCWE